MKNLVDKIVDKFVELTIMFAMGSAGAVYVLCYSSPGEINKLTMFGFIGIAVYFSIWYSLFLEDINKKNENNRRE